MRDINAMAALSDDSAIKFIEPEYYIQAIDPSTDVVTRQGRAPSRESRSRNAATGTSTSLPSSDSPKFTWGVMATGVSNSASRLRSREARVRKRSPKKLVKADKVYLIHCRNTDAMRGTDKH